MMLYQLIAARFPFWCAFLCVSVAILADVKPLSLEAGPVLIPG